MAITDEILNGLRAKNPGVQLEQLIHPTIEADVVARPASEDVWGQFQQMATDAAQKVFANRMLVDTCVVYPAPAELKALIAKHPAIVDVWSGEIAEMAGISRTMRRKKL
jgi:hypothetical protein